MAAQNNKQKLYQVTETEPLSITITERRWKLLGHLLRLQADCPALEAMRYYFEGRTNKKFVGRRTTMVTKINKDIRRTTKMHRDFPITPLISLVKSPKHPHKSEEQKALAKSC